MNNIIIILQVYIMYVNELEYKRKKDKILSKDNKSDNHTLNKHKELQRGHTMNVVNFQEISKMSEKYRKQKENTNNS